MIPKPPLPPAARQADASIDEEIYLMGVTGLDDFLDFVRERVVGGRDMDRGQLTASWREAAEVFKGMETSQSGAADRPTIQPLPKAIQAHVNELADLPHFERTFNTVPIAFGMVELDTLVTTQFHAGRGSIDKCMARMSRPVTDEALAHLCLPLTPPDASFKLSHDDGNRFIFTSDTHDTRFLGARVIDPATIRDFPMTGHAQAVVALAVGFTTNVLNVVRYANRLVLNNGYHRALALRAIGVTHAPCVIQVCSHWEDVGLVGGRELFHNGEIYFTSTRPPLLRDFADPKLTERFSSHRLTREIRLSYEVDTLQLVL